MAPSGGAADAQLADSLTRDLTVAFGRIRWARVVSYALASTYKGTAIDARVVGRELNVRYLVEGEVRSAGEGFITDIQLIDTGAATRAWSNRLQLERGSAEQDPGALVTPLIQQLRAALFAAERAVKPGGRLVYATCSLLREENEAIAEAFLANNPEFELANATEVLAQQQVPLDTGPYLKLMPQQHGTDGFFAAAMTRTS